MREPKESEQDNEIPQKEKDVAVDEAAAAAANSIGMSMVSRVNNDSVRL